MAGNNKRKRFRRRAARRNLALAYVHPKFGETALVGRLLSQEKLVDMYMYYIERKSLEATAIKLAIRREFKRRSPHGVWLASNAEIRLAWRWQEARREFMEAADASEAS